MTSQDKIQKEITEKTVIFYRKNNRGLLNLTMRTGKVKITLETLKSLKHLDKKIIIAYPDNRILNSWVGDQEKFNIELKNVIYVNFSSLKKYTKEKFDWFILDEPQDLSENEMDYAEEIINNSKKVITLTGTVNLELKSILENRLNIEEIAKYTKESAIKDGVVADYKVTVHLVDLDNTIKTKNTKGKLVTEKQRFDAYTWVISKKGNNMFIILARNRISQNSIAKNKKLKELLLKLKEQRVLIFTGLTKQAESLGTAFYHSKCKDDSSIKKFNELKYNHLALADSGKVGTNYEKLDSIILSNFVGDEGKNRQLLDRCAKLDYSSKIADLHIICLNEPNEIKKLNTTLNKLDKNKIIWK